MIAALVEGLLVAAAIDADVRPWRLTWAQRGAVKAFWPDVCASRGRLAFSRRLPSCSPQEPRP